MTENTTIQPLPFRPLSIDDKTSIQAVTLHSGRRNCNFTLVGSHYDNGEGEGKCVQKDIFLDIATLPIS